MNILIQAISTLRNFTPYLYEGNNYCFTGVSSSEPAAKNLILELALSGEKLDLILLLGTEETRQKAACLENTKYNGLSSEEFYECRIQNFMKNADEQADIENGIDEIYLRSKQLVKNKSMIYGFEKTLLSVEYTQEQPVFNVVTYQENSQYAVSELILKLIKSAIDFNVKNEEIKVYVDTQGGHRSLTFVLSMALRMLRIKNITVQAYLYTAFTYGNLFHKIIDVTHEYRLLELASAFDDFIQTARGDRLAEYYSIPNEFVRDPCKTDIHNIVWSISEVSKAISVCDTASMLKEITILADQLNRYESGRDHLFDLFVDDLKASYKGIIDQDHKINTLVLIRWCVNRHLLQQALTLLYERMPEAYVQYGVICFSYSKNTHDELMKYLSSILDDPGLDKNTKNDLLSSPYHLMFSSVGDIYSIESIDSHLPYRLINAYVRPIFDQTFRLYTKLDTVQTSILRKSISNYQELRRIRNKVNHGNSYAVLYDDMISKIENYLLEFDELVNNIKESPNDYEVVLDIENIRNYSSKSKNESLIWTPQEHRFSEAHLFAQNGLLCFWIDEAERDTLRRQLNNLLQDQSIEVEIKEWIQNDPLSFLLVKARRQLHIPNTPEMFSASGYISLFGEEIDVEIADLRIKYKAYTGIPKAEVKNLRKVINQYYEYCNKSEAPPGLVKHKAEITRLIKQSKWKPNINFIV